MNGQKKAYRKFRLAVRRGQQILKPSPKEPTSGASACRNRVLCYTNAPRSAETSPLFAHRIRDAISSRLRRCGRPVGLAVASRPCSATKTQRVRAFPIFLLAKFLLNPLVHSLFRLKRRRSHPLTWLSSHKLGRPVGLAVGLRRPVPTQKDRSCTHPPTIHESPFPPACRRWGGMIRIMLPPTFPMSATGRRLWTQAYSEIAFPQTPPSPPAERAMRRCYGGGVLGEGFVSRVLFVSPQAPAFASAHLATPHKRRRAVARCDACGIMLTQT